MTFVRKSEGTVYFKKGVREDIRKRTPQWLQPAITLFCGKPAQGENLSPAASNPLMILALDLGLIAGSATASVLAISQLNYLGLFAAVLFCLIQIGRLRHLQVSIGHEASHGTFFPKYLRHRWKGATGWRNPNEWVLGLATLIPLVQNGGDYRQDHSNHHSNREFTTLGDADAALLYKLGFKPGMSVSELKRVLWQNIFSPYTHAWFIAERLKSNLIRSQGVRKYVAWIWFLSLLGLGFVLPVESWLMAVFVPLFPGYTISSLLQLVSEHSWFNSKGPILSKTEYADRCWGRFSGVPLPAAELKPMVAIISWTKWLAEMIFLEIPARIAVMPNDLAAHDHHHLAGKMGQKIDDWSNITYAREKVIQELGDPLDQADRELWGIVSAINHGLQAISEAEK